LALALINNELSLEKACDISRLEERH